MQNRVLILAPRGRDAAIAADLLRRSGIEAVVFDALAPMVTALDDGAGAVMITEEALASADRTALSAWVAAQPTWSDLPFVVLANGGTSPRTSTATERLGDLGNVVLLQRPLHAEAMVGAVRSAIKARQRQFEVRAAAETLEQAVAQRTAELQAARDSLAFALEAGGMASWDMDLATGDTQRSPSHDALFGYPAPQPRWTIAHLLHHVNAKDRPAIAAAFDQALTTGTLEFEYPITGADGSARWIAVKGRARYDDDGTPRRLAGVISDTTARRDADAQLAQSQKMDAIGQLTGGVAHDFNNLLTPIVGSLDLVRRRHKDDERTQRMVGGALQAAERAATLTQRLLAFARRQALQPQAVDIGALIDGIVELVRRTLGPTIEVVPEIPDSLPSARVDPNQLELALLNLAINARDAMPEGGRLTLTAAAETVADHDGRGLAAGRYIRLVARDTGTGMDEATLARATEPFFSTKGVGKGTGLGLSMIHGLAAQSGGTLRLDSRLGAGTAVELWLPATDERARVADGVGAEPIPAQRAATVLLVDDEDIVRFATADMLRDIGYRVVEASSASQALIVLQGSSAIDLLVTDYLMPGMTGAALISEMRAAGIPMPALLITGYAARGEDVAADVPRLTKPFRQVDLAAKVHDLLHRTAPDEARRDAAE
ncbi:MULTISPECIES: PAS domain-containing hybrid sensor histidine kinase/response regulator [unclassified Sphingomonas]|uniref:PAS domain-containing hybrid sensor histidine kinase/response regulator n=1 Tax=unclassified Sphingomonas TaxID=196159 RepID=UPI002269DBF6|nr:MULTISPECIES: PAS domain-containing hybrid sensor histidine kinase/response regulator [unclassified Sphingomonas]